VREKEPPPSKRGKEVPGEGHKKRKGKKTEDYREENCPFLRPMAENVRRPKKKKSRESRTRKSAERKITGIRDCRRG